MSKTKTFGRAVEYWQGFEFALLLLEDMFVSTHPHPNNIADCIRAKANRLPKNKIRKTVPSKYKVQQEEKMWNEMDSDLKQLIQSHIAWRKQKYSINKK